MDLLKNPIIINDMNEIYQRCQLNEHFKNKSIYVSGATGMIASYFIYYLIYLNVFHGYNINIIAGFRNLEKARNVFHEYLKADFFHTSIGDINKINSVEWDIDYMLHTASLASPQYYGKNPVETMLPNSIGLNNLLSIARDKKVKSFLFFSSGAVYGSGYKTSFSEDFCGQFEFLSSGSVYGESKRFGEALCKSYFNEYQVPAKSVRIYHTYSPTMDITNDKRAFSEFVKSAVCGNNIVIHSDGSQKRPYCYIVDGVLAIISVLILGRNGETYNLANTKQFVSINELAKTISALSKKNIEIEHKNVTAFGYLNLSHTQDVPCSTDKIEALGCSFTIDINEGFKRVIRFLTKE